jgi:hypothetical protein
MKVSKVIEYLQGYDPEEQLIISWVDRKSFVVDSEETGKEVRATREYWAELVDNFDDLVLISEYDEAEMLTLLARATKEEGKTEPAGRVTVQ